MAYWRVTTRHGVFAVDADTGDERQLATGDLARDLEIWSVENGVLAFTRDYLRGNLTSISVGRSIDDARQLTFGPNAEASNRMRLSPTGAWLTYLLYEFDGPPQNDKVLAYTAQIRDTRTGELVAVSFPRSIFAVPVVWLDDTTLQVLTVGLWPGQTTQQAKMYTCRVPSGSCEVAADLPVDALGSNAFVVPNGQSVS